MCSCRWSDFSTNYWAYYVSQIRKETNNEFQQHVSKLELFHPQHIYSMKSLSYREYTHVLRMKGLKFWNMFLKFIVGFFIIGVLLKAAMPLLRWLFPIYFFQKIVHPPFHFSYTHFVYFMHLAELIFEFSPYSFCLRWGAFIYTEEKI